MFSNQPLPFHSTENYLKRSISNPNYASSSPSPFDENSTKYSPSLSASTKNSNYVPPNSGRKRSLLEPLRSVHGAGKTGGGAIEKTNMMSSENPFIDPARPYEHFKSPRPIVSITSPPKNAGSIVKSLNLSDENPFFDTYSRYQYPSQVDPSKRITTLGNTTARSTENKSLNLSEENPFSPTYGRYSYPSATDSRKQTVETSKPNLPPSSSNNISDENPFNTYRPLTIREYSMSGIPLSTSTGSSSANPSTKISSSIADWVRNHPAPLTYRAIDAGRTTQEYRASSTSTNLLSARETSYSPRLITHRANPSAPLEKTSLNMSPDNPFADTYGRYYYPSADEIKAQKRVHERLNRPIEPSPIRENRIKSHDAFSAQDKFDLNQKEPITGRPKEKFTRFDIDLGI